VPALFGTRVRVSHNSQDESRPQKGWGPAAVPADGCPGALGLRTGKAQPTRGGCQKQRNCHLVRENRLVGGSLQVGDNALTVVPLFGAAGRGAGPACHVRSICRYDK
jgi:hypothetical protein